MGQAVYPSAQPEPVAFAQPVAPPVPFGAPVDIVRPPPLAPLNGLSIDDRNNAAAFAVPDWVAFTAPAKSAPSSWFGFGGGSSSKSSVPSPDEPKVRVFSAALDGISAPTGSLVLEATVRSEAALLRLAQRLAAYGTAPLASLRIKADEDANYGVPVDSFDGSGAGFALLTRALHAFSGQGAESLSGLVELCISQLPIGPEPARALATALSRHPCLAKLELWNCTIEDSGAMDLASLAAADGNMALREFNIGRNLVSGHCREQLELLIDKGRVHAKVY